MLIKASLSYVDGRSLGTLVYWIGTWNIYNSSSYKSDEGRSSLIVYKGRLQSPKFIREPLRKFKDFSVDSFPQRILKK